MYKGDELIFQSEDGAKIKVSKAPLQIMLSFRQMKRGSHESGGVLLGRYLKDSMDVVVDFVTTPKKNDSSTEVFFFKNKDEHQAVIDEKWEETKWTCNYLGEWHTHPEDHPTPSSLDIKTWLRLVKETEFEFGELHFIIVGRKSACAYKVNKRVKQLTPIHE